MDNNKRGVIEDGADDMEEESYRDSMRSMLAAATVQKDHAETGSEVAAAAPALTSTPGPILAELSPDRVAEEADHPEDTATNDRTAASAEGGIGNLKRNRSGSDKKENKFPWMLHKIIDDAEREGNQHIVAWMPSGRSFIVHKRDTFVDHILPRYFRQTKYKSFVRQLNLWGFTYIDQGPDKGSYYRENFVKGKPWLCREMKRLKSKYSPSGGGDSLSPGRAVTSPTPSPYSYGGRAITSGIALHSVPRDPDASSPSFSAIHSKQQSILYNSLRQQGPSNPLQTTTPSESQHSIQASQQYQLPSHHRQKQEHQRRYLDLLQLLPRQRSELGQVMSSPMQLDSPMIQSHHQLAQNMTQTMFAPTLHRPRSSEQFSFVRSLGMTFPPTGSASGGRIMAFASSQEQIISRHLQNHLEAEQNANDRNQQAMSPSQTAGSLGFLPRLTVGSDERVGSVMHTQNTSPIETGDRSGGILGGGSPGKYSGDMTERIDIFCQNASLSSGVEDFNHMLPLELEPRHFRSNDVIETKLGSPHFQTSPFDLQWPSSISLTKQSLEAPQDLEDSKKAPSKSGEEHQKDFHQKTNS